MKQEVKDFAKKEVIFRQGIEKFECVEHLIENYERKIKNLEEKMKVIVEENKHIHTSMEKVGDVNRNLIRNFGQNQHSLNKEVANNFIFSAIFNFLFRFIYP